MGQWSLSTECLSPTGDTYSSEISRFDLHTLLVVKLGAGTICGYEKPPAATSNTVAVATEYSTGTDAPQHDKLIRAASRFTPHELSMSFG